MLATMRTDTLSLVIAYRHGFWGIFLLAAWPNALFDLCGICCGHFLMPFWEFIGATMAGKALVKVRCPLPRVGRRAGLIDHPSMARQQHSNACMSSFTCKVIVART